MHQERPPVDTSRPNPARRYDYWLGGKDNVAADRQSADQIAQVFPQIRTAVRENRRFLHRVVGFLTAEAGIHQFLDIGTGLPASPNVHQVAQNIAPAARIVYVDNDPMVVTHARARTTSTPQGATAYAHADLRSPQTILTDPAIHATLDLTRPVGLLLVAVLHFLDDHDNPHEAVTQLIEALPPGSYLAISHASLDRLPVHTAGQLAALTATGAHGSFHPRTRDEITAFLHDLEPVDPGLVPITQWHPQRAPKPETSTEETAIYGAVARLP
ncbi:SAM-dependent methyltransferase [Plantactinospora mayteni]|nr:SAM-dependent methyltransferase [Plantactinospora mayteni]